MAAVLFGLVMGAMRLYDTIINTVEAPYLLDETEENAQRMIKRAGLTAVIRRASDENKPAGTVISQSPAYETRMRRNETIVITVSTGPAEQAAPGLTGLSLGDAMAKAQRRGFTVLALQERELSARPWDTVLRQSPEEGQTMPNGSVIQVTLSGGSVTLPSLVGKTRQEALLTIQQLNLKLTEIQEIPVEDKSQFDRVAAQQYSDGKNTFLPGEEAMQQTQVTLAIYVRYVPETADAQKATEEAP